MEQYDICIVGAGIAGSTLALELSKRNYKILLIEKDNFPRFHIGCSFSAGVIKHWIPHFGLNEMLTKAKIEEKQYVEVTWESDHTIAKEEKGYLIDRSKFDSLLIDKCIENEIQVIFYSNSINYINKGENGWNILIRENCISTKILVEATGRKPSVIKSGKQKYLPKLLSVYGFLDQQTENPQIKAYENFWTWKTPYRDKTLIVVCSNPITINNNGGMISFFNNIVQNELNHVMSSSEISTVNTCDATANYDLAPIGINYIKIGDAAFTLDPLSSQGIAKAFKSVSYAIRIVNTMFSKPKLNQDLIHFYTDVIKNEVENNKNWTLDFYKMQNKFNSDFWNLNKEINNKTYTLNTNFKLDDNLIINPKIEIKRTGIVDSEYIEFKDALFLDSKSFCYVNSLYIPNVINKLNGLKIIEILNFFHTNFTKQESMSFLKFFVENKILVRNKQQ